MALLIAIPARGKSKGLAGKNLRQVGGAALAARAVLAARQFVGSASLDDAVIFVDTDDEPTAAVGRAWGADVPFLRSPSLARDETSSVDTVLGALERWESIGRAFDAVMLLQPTSPLRQAADLTRCWDRFKQSGAPSVVGIAPTEHPVGLALRWAADGTISWVGDGPRLFVRRQDFDPSWWASGSVYIATVEEIRSARSFVRAGITIGVALNRRCAVDINDADDLEIADAIARGTRPKPTTIMDHKLGGGAPCFIIAEAGVNHNGDSELAHQLIDIAADAGVDAVKFQTFDPNALAAPSAPKAKYQSDRTGAGESQLEMLRHLTLPLDTYHALQAHATQRGVLFLSTAFDSGSADFLERELNLAAFKVPSGELTNHSFLKHLAQKARPLLVSTGMARLDEVGDALGVIAAAGGHIGALFHCVTNYPVAPEDCNLRAMATMRAAFGLPVGWSDHSEGIELSLAAVATGAEILEKHFTVDRTLQGPDHAASLEPNELRALINGVRRIEAALGDGNKTQRPAERPLALVVRRSLHTTRALTAGTALTVADLAALRPGTGISPAHLRRIVGRCLTHTLPAGAMLKETDLA